MPALRSYVNGSWFTPSDAGAPVNDAVTGAEVARLSTAGIDMADVLAYSRKHGGPALRELTFHQRAAILKSLATDLRGNRDVLYDLSTRTGATRRDATFDVDGGIGTLFGYASKGRRELPDDTVYVDGAVEALGRGGQFVGQHIMTSRLGVAVQINAFNFPVWGPLEKFAQSFLAGVPSVVKPASPTAYVTSALVELMLDSDLLPEGSLQVLCGSAGDLLDHLDEQDSVSFTGSAATAQRLHRHPNVLGRSVRFTAEADSLNCSILGPDAGTRHGRVRPVRRPTGDRDDGQGRTEVHRDPARVRPAGFRRCGHRRGRRAAGSGGRRSPGRSVRGRGRPGQPGAARGGAPQREGAGCGRPPGVRRPGPRRGRRRGRGARGVRLADAAAGRGRPRPGTARGRGLRTGEHRARLPRCRRRHPAGRDGPGQSGRFGGLRTTPRSCARSCWVWRRGTDACSSSIATTPPSRPGTVPRCRR